MCISIHSDSPARFLSSLRSETICFCVYLLVLHYVLSTGLDSEDKQINYSFCSPSQSTLGNKYIKEYLFFSSLFKSMGYIIFLIIVVLKSCLIIAE